MEKDLPGVFRNPINHPINNNKEMEYVGKNTKIEVEEKAIVSKEEQIKNDLFGGDIKRKINNIFNSPTYVYKADVEISTNKGTVTKKIVGHNKKELITIDNELISIDDIIDIKIVG